MCPALRRDKHWIESCVELYWDPLSSDVVFSMRLIKLDEGC